MTYLHDCNNTKKNQKNIVSIVAWTHSSNISQILVCLLYKAHHAALLLRIKIEVNYSSSASLYYIWLF